MPAPPVAVWAIVRAVMTDFRPVLYVQGWLLIVLAAAMGIPAVLESLEGNPDWRVFLAAAAFTLFFAIALLAALREQRDRLGIRQGFLPTGTARLVTSAFLMFVGGCLGSTSGGTKIFRLQIFWIRLRSQLGRLLQPLVLLMPGWWRADRAVNLVRRRSV